MRVIYQKHFSFLLSKNLLEGDGCLPLIFPFPAGSTGKELTCQCRRHDRQVQCLGREDYLEKAMATLSSILAWEKSMYREAWRFTVHRVTELDTTECVSAHTHVHTLAHAHTKPRIFLIVKSNRMKYFKYWTAIPVLCFDIMANGHTFCIKGFIL